MTFIEQAGRVLIIEDNVSAARMVAEFLELHGYSVECAHDGLDGLHRAASGSFDAIVLDLTLPGLGGLEVVRRLREDAKKNTPVLMVSARDTIDDKIQGFESGADDYLGKPFEARELGARIRALIRRERRQLSPVILRVADLTFDTQTLEVTRRGRMLYPGPIPMKLLKILMRESPRVVSRTDIERELWGDALPGSDVLRTHLYSLRQVIDKPFDRPLVHTIHQSGYRLIDLEARMTHPQISGPI